MYSKCLLLTAIVGLSSAAVVSAADAEWQLKPGIRALHFDNDRRLDEDKVGGSLGLEYQYGNWGTELQLWSNEGETAVGNNSLDVKGAYLNQYRYFNQGASFNPYLVFGVGHADYDSRVFSDGESQANVGLGFKHRLADKFSWWMDARNVHGVDDSNNDVVVGLGLAFHFGQSAAKPAAIAVQAPADTDGDGVMDANDACPNSAAGAAVDTRGCELDSDGDGVVDSVDKCPNSVTGEKVNRSGCKPKVTRVEEIRLEVHFASSSVSIQPNYQAPVQKLAEFMRKFTDLNVIIEGYTDSQGSVEFNQLLSERRAQAIKTALVERYGIATSRVTIKGYGESRPIASNETSAGRLENRRVIAVLTKTVDG
jgi:OOP family OmpA-OmpF porin